MCRSSFFVGGGLMLRGSGSVWCSGCGDVFFVVGVFVVSVSLLSVVVWFVVVVLSRVLF